MAAQGKRIGFVDYELDNFHANVYLKAFRNELKDRGYSVAACTAMKAKTGRQWAEANGVPYFDDMAEMDANTDVYMVLAPSNPETHLELCKRTLPFGKTTYVDKTFAQDLATAKKIFALADRYKVAMQTSSALRYTAVQKYVAEAGGPAKVRHMVAWGPGRSFDEYAIHPVETVVSCMGAKVETMMRRGTGKQSQLLLNYTGGRTAVINVYVQAKTPYAAAVTTKDETRYIPVDVGSLFLDTAAALLDFFEAGKPRIPRAESLAIRRILDLSATANAQKRFVKV